MSSQASAAAPLTFEQFWKWLNSHRNCLVRAGSGDVMLFDHEMLHWDFFDEPEGEAVCQLIAGKALVGELVIERSEVLFVQASVDLDDPQRGHWMFECMAGGGGESVPLASFVLVHGMETPAGHAMLKH